MIKNVSSTQIPITHVLPQMRHVARSGLTQIALVLAGSLLVAISAQLAFVLPFTVVPITAQTFAVLLVGALLGSRLGAAAIVVYLLEGLAGLPVFALGGAGPVHLFGPTCGFLFGFIPAAMLVGRLAQQGSNGGVLRTALAMTLGTAIIFVCGLAWLTPLVGVDRVLMIALVPYLPGAIAKIAAAMIVVPLGWRVLDMFSHQN